MGGNAIKDPRAQGFCDTIHQGISTAPGYPYPEKICQHPEWDTGYPPLPYSHGKEK
jgi:hypothetical protein